MMIVDVMYSGINPDMVRQIISAFETSNTIITDRDGVRAHNSTPYRNLAVRCNDHRSRIHSRSAPAALYCTTFAYALRASIQQRSYGTIKL